MSLHCSHNNSRILRIDTVSGTVQRVAGSGAIEERLSFRDDFNSSTDFLSSVLWETPIRGNCRSPGYSTTLACFNVLPNITYAAATVPNANSGTLPVLSGLARITIPSGSILRTGVDVRALADYGVNGVPIVPLKIGFADQLAAIECLVDGSENLGQIVSGGIIAYDIVPPPGGGAPVPRWHFAYIGIFVNTVSWQPRLRYVSFSTGALTTVNLDFSIVSPQLQAARIGLRMERRSNGWLLLNRLATSTTWNRVRAQSSPTELVGDESIFYDYYMPYGGWSLQTLRYGLYGEGATTAFTVSLSFDYVGALLSSVKPGGDDGPAESASLSRPGGMAFDTAGALHFAE